MCWPALSSACVVRHGRSRSSGQTRRKGLFAATGEAIDFAFHVVELTFEIVDIAGFAGTFFSFRGFATAAFPTRKRRRHRKRALEHIHIAPNLLFQRRERADPEGLRQLLAELFLL